MKGRLNFLLDPKSIAVVGVSKDITKLSSVIYNNILDSGYEGELHAVNPRYDDVFGKKCYKRVSDIEVSVDMAIFVIPAQFIIDELKDAVKNKFIKAAVIISAGFKEAGPEGIEKEKELTEISKKYGVRILGPNCLGYINTKADLNASFATSAPARGDIMFSSQSGAFCTAALDIAQERNLGFSHFVSYGNKSDINEIDLINFGLDDSTVKVLGAYIEEITDGRELYSLIKEGPQKPVIILNPGKSEKAQKAISSHTGSMIQPTIFRNQALKQSGAMHVDRMDTMFDLLMTFSWSKPLRGKRIAIVTNAGGPGIIAADMLDEVGLEVADLAENTKDAMRKCLPKTACVDNPVDVIGDALAERYAAPLGVLEEDPNVDGILVVLTPQLITQIEETAKLIINHNKVSTKPVFAAFLGGKYVKSGVERLYDHRIPVFHFVENAVEAMKYMYEFYSFDETQARLYSSIDAVKLSTKNKEEIKAVTKDEEKPLPEGLVEALAKEFSIDFPKQIISNDVAKVTKFAKDKFPVVMKVTTESVIHKTDAKMIYLNLKSEKEVKEAFVNIQAEVKKLTKAKADVDVLVQEMIVGGEECFVGINRDGTKGVYSSKDDTGFGHMIVFGKGGIYTEVYEDIASRLVPLTSAGIKEMVDSTKVSKILKGARTGNKLALKKVHELLANVQKMVVSYPEISSLDINPVIVTEDRAVVVDMKIFVQK